MKPSPVPTIMVRPREGKTLTYNRTVCLPETWCLTHPTHFKRNQYLCHLEGVTQSQQIGTLKPPGLCKLDSAEGKTNSFIMVIWGFVLVLFF